MSRELVLPGGVRTVIGVRSEESGGAFTLLSDTAPPGWALPPHAHRAESETIHVTSGRLWLELDGVRRELAAGDTAHVPAGVRHAGGTLGDEPVSRVVVFSPGGMEGLFERLAAGTDARASLALAQQFGWEF